jgi:hypothetical protein
MRIRATVWAVLAIFAGVVVFLAAGTSGHDGKTPRIGTTYSFESEDDNLFGHAKVTAVDDSSITIEYAFIIEDATIKNNGKCTDKIGDWCSNDPGGEHARIESTKYRYGIVFESHLEESDPAGVPVLPVYCNKDEVKESPERALLNPDERIDTTCGMDDIALWQPTSTFKVANRDTFATIDDFLESDLVIFDTSGLYSYSYTDGSLTKNAAAVKNFPVEPRIKNYSFQEI